MENLDVRKFVVRSTHPQDHVTAGKTAAEIDQCDSMEWVGQLRQKTQQHADCPSSSQDVGCFSEFFPNRNTPCTFPAGLSVLPSGETG